MQRRLFVAQADSVATSPREACSQGSVAAQRAHSHLPWRHPILAEAFDSRSLAQSALLACVESTPAPKTQSKLSTASHRMASMRTPQARWKLWTASHCVASASPPDFVSMSVPAPGATLAPAGEPTRPKSQLARAARPLPQPAVTLESELVELALRPQFDLAAAWAASIPRLLSASQSPRWVPSSLQLDPKSRLAVAARPLPQPVALRWVWRSRIPTQNWLRRFRCHDGGAVETFNGPFAGGVAAGLVETESGGTLGVGVAETVRSASGFGSMAAWATSIPRLLSGGVAGFFLGATESEVATSGRRTWRNGGVTPALRSRVAARGRLLPMPVPLRGSVDQRASRRRRRPGTFKAVARGFLLRCSWIEVATSGGGATFAVPVAVTRVWRSRVPTRTGCVDTGLDELGRCTAESTPSGDVASRSHCRAVASLASSVQLDPKSRLAVAARPLPHRLRYAGFGDRGFRRNCRRCTYHGALFGRTATRRRRRRSWRCRLFRGRLRRFLFE